MKKFGFVVMIIVLLLGIAACDSGKLAAKETEIAASFRTQLDDALAVKDKLVEETQKKLDDALAAKDELVEESKKKLDDALAAKDTLIDEKDKLIEEGKTALENLKTEADSKFADKDAYSSSLESVVGKLNTTIEESKTTVADLQKKLDDALQTAKDGQEKISTLESELAAFSEGESEKADTQQLLADKDAYSSSLESVVGKLNTTIEENKTMIADLQKKLDDALQAAKDSQEKVSTLESELTAFSEVKSEKADLQTKFDEASALIEEGKTKIADMESKLMEGDKSLAAKNSYIDSLESIVRKMNTTIGDLKKTNAELQTKLDEALTAEKPEEPKE